MAGRLGNYGYLGEHLLELRWRQEGYAFWTKEKDIIEKYGFVGVKNEYWDRLDYFLKIDDPSTVSAYYVRTDCRYKGFRFSLQSISDERVYTMFPEAAAMAYFKDYPRHGYDPVYYAKEEEVTDVWEAFSPIKGFRFDVERIVYLKKDGVWIADSPLSPMSSARGEAKKDELVHDNSQVSEEVAEENASGILLVKADDIMLTLFVIKAFLLIVYFFSRCV